MHAHVRVLWDIENLAVPRTLGAIETVSRLKSFLCTKELAGSGVDCRLTAFFNFDGGSVSAATKKELDQADVEMVPCEFRVT